MPGHPFAEILLEETDDWAPNDFLYGVELPAPPSTPITTATCLPSICSSTDLNTLRRHVQMSVTEHLAARPLSHLG
jgi:hypothetical protein